MNDEENVDNSIDNSIEEKSVTPDQRLEGTPGYLSPELLFVLIHNKNNNVLQEGSVNRNQTE